MNYMEQVANMLGVELEEEFKVEEYDSYIFKITKDGLYLKCNDRWKRVIRTIMDDILCGRIEIKKLILDDVEKEYLSNVIKPFRDKVTGVIKWGKEIGKGLEYIVVIYTDDCKERGMGFPCFKEGTMYKGMEANKQYSLEDLGL